VLAEAIEAAGLPAGVVSIVASDRVVGQHLIAHPGVDKVAFTGSTAAGRRIMATCAERMKRVTLELGGKSAAIFLDDVDLGEAIPQFLPGAIVNNGEACSALTRVLVPRERHDEIVDALCASFGMLPVGDPFDENTVFGPLISAQHRDRVEGYIALGQEEGATLVQGGGRPAGLERGWYVEPTILTGVSNGMRIAQEEIFGPVLSVIPYEGDAEAVALANDSLYGLAGSVFTSDLERGFDIGRNVRAGTFTVNGFGVDVAAPFGGFKQSGLGREGGIEGLHHYLESKTLFLPEGFTPAAWS
jgi:betaine-aldehyde dehydrogenase